MLRPSGHRGRRSTRCRKKDVAESVLHCEDYQYGFKRSALALVWRNVQRTVLIDTALM